MGLGNKMKKRGGGREGKNETKERKTPQKIKVHYSDPQCG